MSSSSSRNANLRAILIPTSESTIYSLDLPENCGVCSPVGDSTQLPSPCSSSSEDEGSNPPSEAASGSRTHSNRRRRNRSRAIWLGQSGNTERFTLGASKSNDVILEHPQHADEECCYINLVHVQLYPDPDRDSLVVYNNSNLVFFAQSLTTHPATSTIPPSKEASLERGSWQLTLGKGLAFEIKIIPWAAREKAREELDGWSLISPLPAINAEPKDRQELIGKTTRTLVFKATRNKAVVAIKLCRKPTLKESADTWRNETEIMTRLGDHPSIVKLLHYDALDLRLELEYVGPDLSKFVDRQRMWKLPEATSHQIWMDISNAMKHIHARKVLHLDVKPENILLGPGGRAKICDFGFSVQEAEGPIPYNGGTPRYTPPEYVLTGERGRPADIWGLGIVMMFLLRIIPLPFAGSWTIANIRHEAEPAARMNEWFDAVERSKNRIPAKYSLLLEMLVKNPGRRITFSELVTKLPALPQAKNLAGELLA